MQIRYDFSALWGLAEELGATRLNLPVDLHGSVGAIDAQLAGKGIEVELADVQSIGGLLGYEGRQILLYIPDQGRAITDVIEGVRDKGKKFHVAHCSTLENMKKQGRFERYIATTKVDGKFHVHGVDMYGVEQQKEDAELYVCQFCLNMLNYQQARTNRSAKAIRESFNLRDFFETYSSIFPYRPSRTRVEPLSAGYSHDWEQISRQIRNQAAWRCEDCNVDLSDQQYLLHVHHKDGVKQNNSRSNLMVLCAACHRDQPLHEHLYLSHDQYRAITRLRKKQGLLRPGWESVIKMADPALRGVLGLAKAQGVQPPELEFALTNELFLDVAWPNLRMAISLTMPTPSITGWKVFDHARALAHFA